jgi:hypothetical protein
MDSGGGINMGEYELQARHDSRNSFYGKAKVIESEVNGVLIEKLVSYNTEVAMIIDSKVAIVTDTYSHTTLRHIKEFLLQNRFRADTKKQILRDYSPKLFLKAPALEK